MKNLEEMVTEKHGALHDCRSNFCHTNILLDSVQSWKKYMTNLQELATFQSSRRWCQVARNRRHYHSPTARMHSCPKCFRLQQPWAYCGWCPGGKTSKKGHQDENWLLVSSHSRFSLKTRIIVFKNRCSLMFLQISTQTHGINSPMPQK